MIVANELRIGNWVNFGAFGDKQWCIGDYEIYFADEDSKSEYINPIPISPEALLKSGFKEYHFYSDQPAYKKGKYFIIQNWFQAIVGEKAAAILNQDMKYIHQLQNIWFALEREELQITL